MMDAIATFAPALAARRLSYSLEPGRILRDPIELALELGEGTARAAISLGEGASARIILRIGLGSDAAGPLADDMRASGAFAAGPRAAGPRAAERIAANRFAAGPRAAGPFAEKLRGAGILGSAIDVALAPGASLELMVYSASDGAVSSDGAVALGGPAARAAAAGFDAAVAAGTALIREALFSARLAEGSTLRMTEACFDALPGLHRADVELLGRGASVDLAGAYAAAGRTEREHEVSVRHASPATTSRIALASALARSARLRFTGLIHVLPGAAGADAFLSNRNLILDDGARAESLPQLRIEHDEVECSHGSASGGPDPEQLFYLRSRGIGPDEARSLIAMGHLGAVLARFPEALAAEAEAAAAALVLGGFRP